MSRSYDWSPLGLSSDPVPGEPDVVLRSGRSYVATADAIAGAARKLDGIDVGDYVSKAVDELRDTASKVAKDIRKAEKRYRATGDALTGYAPHLERAQRDSLAALQSARGAHHDADAASAQSKHYLSLADKADDPDTALKYRNLGTDDHDATAASHALASATSQLHDATSARDRAAEHAIHQIDEITQHDGLKDSWWDDWGADLLKIITEVAGWVAAIAGVLALVLCWVPILGQVLLVIAAVAAIVQAVGSVILAATGEMSWTEALIAVVGAVLACVGLGGGAKILLAAGKIGRAGKTLLAASRVGRAGKSLAAMRQVNRLAKLQELGPGEQIEKITVRQALKISEKEWDESLAHWNADVPQPTQGQPIYRTYNSSGTHPAGGSWSPTDPTTYQFPESTMGLPKGSTPDSLVTGTLDDPSKVDIVRHALPYNGNPGGAPEFKYIPRGSFADKGITGVSVSPFP